MTRTQLLAKLDTKAKLARRKMSEANQRDDRVETRAYAVEYSDTKLFMEQLKALKSLD
ncbi:hypothetical protein SEA_LILMARTIN_148 [Streptomyces phage LilMartin]|nr:hypothetical protein SEA_LILMARTIN_148 [Streptomyces phage LilMartin]QNO12555.1 hypothetical protein SEA_MULCHMANSION_150 [Streptomyces phage MulchMansion]UVK61225.1 hypothetical protein SEA_ANGELA_150 [Streptomyces phage Angela]